MLILGIETSCDDTAAALVEVRRGRFVVHKNLVASQAKLHAKYKGVVPEVAARAHLETIVPVINEVLIGEDTTPNPSSKRRGSQKIPSLTRRGKGVVLDAIAVTAGPGLITSLLVGVETAKALSYAWGVPLVGVNHIEGHIYSVTLSSVETRHASSLQIPNIKFPAIALIASGGHTELILMTNHGQYKLLGRTRDDAAGETFDKAAAMLGLPYPGGPEISKLAERGNPAAFTLPRPMLDRPDFEFSFSGLKNAIRLLVEELKKSPLLSDLSAVASCRPKPWSPTLQSIGDGVRRVMAKVEERVRACPVPRIKCGAGLDTGVRSGGATRTIQTHPTLTLPSPLKGEGMSLNDLCAAIEQAIVDVLVTKSIAAVAKHHPKSFILAGGVGANKKLRQTLRDNLPPATKFLVPRPEYCMDNAAMIAAAAYHHIKNKNFARYDKLKADANWELV